MKTLKYFFKEDIQDLINISNYDLKIFNIGLENEESFISTKKNIFKNIFYLNINLIFYISIIIKKINLKNKNEKF